MAKKNDAAYEKFLADLKEINPQVEELIKDEKVSSKLRESVLARAEFSSSMDALKAERESFADEVAEARHKISGWQQWYKDVSTESVGLQDQVKKYKDLYGDLQDGKRHQATDDMLSKDDFRKQMNEELQRRDLANLKFATDLNSITQDFRERFKSKLPTEDVYKIAGEQQVSLETAYKMFIADRVEEQTKQQYAEDIAKAKKEAVAEFISTSKLPGISSNPDHQAGVHTLDVQNAPSTPRDRIAAAMQTLNRGRSGS